MMKLLQLSVACLSISSVPVVFASDAGNLRGRAAEDVGSSKLLVLDPSDNSLLTTSSGPQFNFPAKVDGYHVPAVVGAAQLLPVPVGAQEEHGVATQDEPQGEPQAAAVAVVPQAQAQTQGPNDTPNKNRRRFVSYSSSEWELFWLDNVDKLENSKSICDVLINDQAHYIHDFLNLLCTSRLEAPHDKWCVIDDDSVPMWYNTQNIDNLEITFERPADIPMDVVIPPPKPVTPGPEHSHIVSKFVFYDEVKNEHYVEYIEPLVSHLRFPLSKCIAPPKGKGAYKYHDTMFRGWIIPPPPVLRGDRAVYVDAGATSWDKDTSSLKFFTNVWARHGVLFDETFAFERQTTVADFYQSLPKEHHSTTHYRQCDIANRPEDGSKTHPFLPVFIDVNTSSNDYVLFKLDVTSSDLEIGNIEFILNDPDTHVDEIVWEHHVQGNYLMTEHWQDRASPVSMRLSYEYFLRLRKKGIRAHSWV